MISRLDRLQGRDIYENTALAKLNEVIDAVNELQTAKDVMFNRIDRLNDAMCDMRKRITALEDPTYHKAEPADPYAEQRKWSGKLCKFWDKDCKDCIYDILHHIEPDCFYLYKTREFGGGYSHCEPVKPDDDIIYKGEQ